MEIRRLLWQMFKLKSCHKKILQKKKTTKKNDEAQACASIHVDSVKKNKKTPKSHRCPHPTDERAVMRREERMFVA